MHAQGGSLMLGMCHNQQAINEWQKKGMNFEITMIPWYHMQGAHFIGISLLKWQFLKILLIFQTFTNREKNEWYRIKHFLITKKGYQDVLFKTTVLAKTYLWIGPWYLILSLFKFETDHFNKVNDGHWILT